LSILTLSVFIASIPVYLTQLQMLCRSTSCLPGQLTPDTAQTLQPFGLSVGIYAALSVALIVVTVLMWFTVAAVIIWRKSDDWMALLAALMLITLSVASTSAIISPLENSSLPWPLLTHGVDFISTISFCLVFSLFPDGRFVPRWMGWYAVVSSVGYLIYSFFLDPLDASDDIAALGALPIALRVLIVLMVFGILLIPVLAQIYRYLRVSDPVQRQQTKWIIFGIAVAVVGYFGGYLPTLIFPSASTPTSVYPLLLNPALTCILLLIPLSIGFAMLRYRLWEVDVLINRTLVYGSLTGILAVVYALSIFVFQSFLSNLVGGSALAIVGSTLAIAALFQPLRRRIQQIIDRRFFRRKYDAAQTLAAFSATLRTEVDLSQLSEQVLTVVQETMQPEHVSLWLRPHQGEVKRTTRLLPGRVEEGRQSQ